MLLLQYYCCLIKTKEQFRVNILGIKNVYSELFLGILYCMLQKEFER